MGKQTSGEKKKKDLAPHESDPEKKQEFHKEPPTETKQQQGFTRKHKTRSNHPFPPPPSPPLHHPLPHWRSGTQDNVGLAAHLFHAEHGVIRLDIEGGGREFLFPLHERRRFGTEALFSTKNVFGGR